MLRRSAIEKIIEILRKDARRALRLFVEGFPRPYYCSFLLRDIKSFNVWASAGSLYRKRSDHTRHVNCDLRVGSYRYDQVTDGGLHEEDEDDKDPSENIRIPTDDRYYDGLRLSLWRLTEAKFREALAEYNTKEADRITTGDRAELPSFSRLPKARFVKLARREHLDEERWTAICRRVSRWLSQLPYVTESWVEFEATRETKILVSTEGRIIVQQAPVYSLSATMRKHTKDGSTIQQELVLNVGSLAELPSIEALKKRLMKRHEQLVKLVRSRTIHSFSGPVLLMPSAAGLLFHEALGHRLEGSRLLSSGEGQTFRDQIGKQVIASDITVRDDPTLREFGGMRCIGAYQFDDEGTPARDTVLIERGVLKEFLSTRAPLTKRGHRSNGHARNQKHERAISRMAVFKVEGNRAMSLTALKAMLVDEIRRQRKPFGMIVYDTTNGETATDRYNFQGFRGEVQYAHLVHPDGREEPVRGVNLVGTPLQALNNIIAVGDEAEVDNSYCGAESGMVPVTTIAPPVLLSNLELQTKEEEVVAQAILPRPKL